MFKKLSILAAFSVALAAPVFAEGNVKAGKKVYFKCMKCHSVTRDRHKVGPTMYQIIGRQVGSAKDFKYSRALQELGANGVVWNEETLNAFLRKPREYAKGTRMKFSGLKNEQDRLDIIAYMKTM